MAPFWEVGEALWAEVRVRRGSLKGRGLRSEVRGSKLHARCDEAYAIAIATVVNARIRYESAIVFCGVDCVEDTFSRE